jgi:hypothetical protein
MFLVFTIINIPCKLPETHNKYCKSHVICKLSKIVKYLLASAGGFSTSIWGVFM